MSYDVHLEIQTGPPYNQTDEFGTWDESGYIDVFDWNYTSNCGPMWRAVGCDLADFDGQPATDLGSSLRSAVEAMTADPEKYRAMNPENGWGDYDSLLERLTALADACTRHPYTTVRVYR